MGIAWQEVGRAACGEKRPVYSENDYRSPHDGPDRSSIAPELEIKLRRMGSVMSPCAWAVRMSVRRAGTATAR